MFGLLSFLTTFRKLIAGVLSCVYLFILSSESIAQDVDARALFSSNYQEARQKFISAVVNAGGDLEHYRLPQDGIDGRPLYTDVATFNLNGASKVLVLGCGTHGVEGFAGSAIQIGLLQEGITRRLKQGVGILFYHGLNPYGFSYLRRFNEDNVDINRNFVNHSSPYPANNGYEVLAWLMEPTSISLWSQIKTQSVLAWYRVMSGEEWLQKAVSRGQYTHPEGLFFGGHSVAWSNRVLQQIAESHLSQSAEVILIDFHTGLGEYAAAEVILAEGTESPMYEKAYAIWGDLVRSTVAGDSVSPPIEGALKYAFPRMLPKADVVAVSLEFGTYPPTDIFWALWRENYLYRNPSDPRHDLASISENLREAFYPNDTAWQEHIWSQGREVTYKALESLLEPGKQSDHFE